ncbi:HAMP domain-containing protein [Aerophototrophica crusticola]|uniref:HAMP domain-containing protein n=1 Tax=Aerophototrophica crusticola TaxID=1709002 RepID=A0A858R614_9PROT|nr:HAMP domain-containing protein [Rhodospirillaceae bacterium B3]
MPTADFLRNLTIPQRLSAIVGVFVLGILLLIAFSLYALQGSVMDGRKTLAQSAVQSAHSVVAAYGEREAKGTLSRADAQAAALAALRAMRFDGGEYVWVNDTRHVMVMHPVKPELDGKDMSGFKDPAGTQIFQLFVSTATAAEAGGFVDYMWPKPGHDEPVAKTSYVRQYQPWGWVIGSGVYVDEVQAEAWRESVMVLAEAFIVSTLAILLAVWVGRDLLRAFGRLTTATQRLADGALETEIADSDLRNEIGAMARALTIFRDGLATARRLAREQAAEQEAKLRRQEAQEQLARDFNAAVSGQLRAVAAAATELEATAASLLQQAEQTGSLSDRVADQAGQARSNSEAVAAAAEELTASTGEIGHQVERTTMTTGEAVENAAQAETIVKDLAAVVTDVNAVVSFIQDIAAQTNLLALNATIEAARAGEAGKGFAVVAGEVKALANQTARATEDIQAKVQAVQAAAAHAGQAINAIARTVAAVDESSTAIASAVTEQGAATDEISRNIHHAAHMTAEVAASMGQMRESAISTKAASTQLFAAAGELSEKAEGLRREVEDFLSAMASAQDRRRFARRDMDLPAALTLPGNRKDPSRTGQGRLLNLSDGGAAVRVDLPAHVGEEVTLELSGETLAGRVVDVTDGVIRLQFRHDDRTTAAVHKLHDRLLAA